jgi:hypothetical protein
MSEPWCSTKRFPRCDSSRVFQNLLRRSRSFRNSGVLCTEDDPSLQARFDRPGQRPRLTFIVAEFDGHLPPLAAGGVVRVGEQDAVLSAFGPALFISVETTSPNPVAVGSPNPAAANHGKSPTRSTRRLCGKQISANTMNAPRRMHTRSPKPLKIHIDAFLQVLSVPESPGDSPSMWQVICAALW